MFYDVSIFRHIFFFISSFFSFVSRYLFDENFKSMSDSSVLHRFAVFIMSAALQRCVKCRQFKAFALFERFASAVNNT